MNLFDGYGDAVAFSPNLGSL